MPNAQGLLRRLRHGLEETQNAAAAVLTMGESVAVRKGGRYAATAN